MIFRKSMLLVSVSVPLLLCVSASPIARDGAAVEYPVDKRGFVDPPSPHYPRAKQHHPGLTKRDAVVIDPDGGLVKPGFPGSDAPHANFPKLKPHHPPSPVKRELVIYTGPDGSRRVIGHVKGPNEPGFTTPRHPPSGDDGGFSDEHSLERRRANGPHGKLERRDGGGSFDEHALSAAAYTKEVSKQDRFPLNHHFHGDNNCDHPAPGAPPCGDYGDSRIEKRELQVVEGEEPAARPQIERREVMDDEHSGHALWIEERSVNAEPEGARSIHDHAWLHRAAEKRTWPQQPVDDYDGIHGDDDSGLQKRDSDARSDLLPGGGPPSGSSDDGGGSNSRSCSDAGCQPHSRGAKVISRVAESKVERRDVAGDDHASDLVKRSPDKYDGNRGGPGFYCDHSRHPSGICAPGGGHGGGAVSGVSESKIERRDAGHYPFVNDYELADRLPRLSKRSLDHERRDLGHIPSINDEKFADLRSIAAKRSVGQDQHVERRDGPYFEDVEKHKGSHKPKSRKRSLPDKSGALITWDKKTATSSINILTKLNAQAASSGSSDHGIPDHYGDCTCALYPGDLSWDDKGKPTKQGSCVGKFVTEAIKWGKCTITGKDEINCNEDVKSLPKTDAHGQGDLIPDGGNRVPDLKG